MGSFAAVSRSYNILLSSTIQRCSTIYGKRHIYGAAEMGLHGYLKNRERTTFQNKNLHEIREHMAKYIESETERVINTDDLKVAVHVAEPEDIPHVIGMIKLFNKQNRDPNAVEYLFGPVVMRMFHHLNQADAALQALNMEELEGFFDQLASYQIVLDLLYKNEKYEEVLSVFRDVQGKKLKGHKYPKSHLNIALAACFKMNTQESYTTMMEIMDGVKECGADTTARVINFAAVLALKQNSPQMCLEFLSLYRSGNKLGKPIRNISILALTDLGRVKETLPILSSNLHNVLQGILLSRKLFFEDVIIKVKQAVEGTGDEELIGEFEKVLKGLNENNLIDERTLDGFLCQEIIIPKTRGSFNPNSGNQWQGDRFNPNSGNQWQGDRY